MHHFIFDPSSSKKCLLDMLRCEQLSSDHQDGMRGRVECHQHSSDMKSHVSEGQNPVGLHDIPVLR